MFQCPRKNVRQLRIEPRTVQLWTEAVGPRSDPIRGHLWSLNGYHDDLIQRGKLLSRKDSNLFE